MLPYHMSICVEYSVEPSSTSGGLYLQSNENHKTYSVDQHPGTITIGGTIESNFAIVGALLRYYGNSFFSTVKTCIKEQVD